MLAIEIKVMHLGKITRSSRHRQTIEKIQLASIVNSWYDRPAKETEEEWLERYTKPNKPMPLNLHAKSEGDISLSETTVKSSKMRTKTWIIQVGSVNVINGNLASRKFCFLSRWNNRYQIHHPCLK